MTASMIGDGVEHIHSDDQQEGWDKNQRWVPAKLRLTFANHGPPARMGRRDSEAQEAESSLGDNERSSGNHKIGSHRRQQVRQQLSKDHAAVSRAENL